MEREEAEYCPDCSGKTHEYEKGRACFEYDSRMRASISRFKYHNRREYADFYSEEMLKVLGREIRSWKVDMLVPIPLHKSRMRKRGFNQAELVADRIGDRMGIPVRTDILRRVKKTKPQKELDDTGRRGNLKNAFQACEKQAEGKCILLVDDIYTTGSTIDAAAAELKRQGAEKVYFLSICIGRGF